MEHYYFLQWYPFFLSNSESPAFPYQINLIIFSYALYEALKPLHELGHYYTAKKFAEKQSYVVKFCMEKYPAVIGEYIQMKNARISSYRGQL